MAAPMRGFSERPAVLDVEIGHKLGLRWFRIDEERHRDVRVEQEIGKPPTAWCSCGSTAIVGWFNWDEWIATHHKLRAGLALHGARGRWQPGENVATCAEPDYHKRMGGVPGEVPHEQCGCGFWAYWELGPKQVMPPTVAGIIKGYGDIIEGELGFRCSHAKILAVVPTAYDPTTALNLEDAGYDVYSSLGAMLEMIKAPEGQPPLRAPRPILPGGNTASANNPGATASRAGGNSSFHGLGGSSTVTWHHGGTVTYAGGGAGGTTRTARSAQPKVLSAPEKQELAALRRVRLGYWERLKLMADKAGRQNREFYRSEWRWWDKLNKQMDECDRKIKDLLG